MNLGTKRSHEEDPEEYKTSSNTQSENLAPTVHEYKRSAYDIGTSKPYCKWKLVFLMHCIN